MTSSLAAMWSQESLDDLRSCVRFTVRSLSPSNTEVDVALILRTSSVTSARVLAGWCDHGHTTSAQKIEKWVSVEFQNEPSAWALQNPQKPTEVVTSICTAASVGFSHM